MGVDKEMKEFLKKIKNTWAWDASASWDPVVSLLCICLSVISFVGQCHLNLGIKKKKNIPMAQMMVYTIVWAFIVSLCGVIV